MQENELGKYLEFDDFCLEIRELLLHKFDEDYKIELNKVTKNNNIHLEGIVILQQSETIAPNIYLNNYYIEYCNGLSLNEILENIADEYYNAKIQGDMDTIVECLEFDKIKSNVVYRLINYKKNEKLLEQVPHTRFLDLAVTFHCLVRNSEEGIGTIRITNQHLKIWNIELEVLIQYAKENTPKLFPPVVQSMRKVIEKLMKEDRILQQDYSCNPIGQEASLIDNLHMEVDSSNYSQEDNMLVISNRRNINGASCMIYTDLLKEIADHLESDFYILPSSIHELILVKNDITYNKEVLKEMVTDINLTQVPLEEVLSDNIYFYSRNRLAITQL